MARRPSLLVTCAYAASSVVLGAPPSSAPTFPNAGYAYLMQRAWIIQQTQHACQDLFDAGDSVTARRCLAHIDRVDRYLTSWAKMSPIPRDGWSWCWETVVDDMEFGARCLTAIASACPVTAAGFTDPYRCIHLVQSGAIYASPAARALDFDTPRRTR